MAEKTHVSLVDPTPLVECPEDGLYELPRLRGRNSKSFLLKNGKHRKVATVGPQHYREDGQWKQIDCKSVRLEDDGTCGCVHTPYQFTTFKDEIGYAHKSRDTGGRAELRLTAINGQRPVVGKAEIVDNCVMYKNVARGVDCHFQLLPAKVRAWVVVAQAAEIELVWEIIHTPGVQVAENFPGMDAAGNQLELDVVVVNEPLDDGRTLTRVTKRWRGNAYRRNRRREKEAVKPVYPVYLDPDISEEIVADGDDGFQVDGGSFSSTEVKFGYDGANFQELAAAWRFQGITGIDSMTTIDSAYLKAYQNGNYNGGYSAGTLSFVDADDAPAWSTTPPFSASLTTANTAVAASATDNDKSWDVTTAVQEVVNRAGWTSGNDMAAVIVGAYNVSAAFNYRYFDDYPSSGKHGRLEIDYAGSGGALPKGGLLLLGVGT